MGKKSRLKKEKQAHSASQVTKDNTPIGKFVVGAILLFILITAGLFLVRPDLAECAGTDCATEDTANTTVTNDQLVDNVQISAAQAYELTQSTSDNIQIVDVREPEEFAAGHLPAAVNKPLSQLTEQAVADLNKNELTIVYCRSGNRSAQATALLTEIGFTNLQDMDKGITAWQAADYPVE